MSTNRNQMNRRRFMSNVAFASTALATGAGSWVLRPEWANAAADPIKVGIATDLTGPEIARELMVSPSTMRTHTSHIYGKLGVNSRRAAVRRAEELALL